MKGIVNRISERPRYLKVKRWGKLLSITGGVQIIVQLTGLLSGILIIRLLSQQEYIFYTLANTMLGTMAVLADCGIANGVMSQGGKVWQDKAKLGAVLATGIELRKKFAVVSFLVAVPILCYLLFHHGASIASIIFIVAAIIPAFYAALSDSLLGIVPKLHQNIMPLQRNQAAVNCGRLLTVVVTLFLFPMSYIAILANGIPRAIGNIRLRKIAAIHIEQTAEANAEVRKTILSIVKKSLPDAIYYCLSSQITIWLISIFGATDSIAKIGALGRLAMVLTLFAVVFNTLITPRFARLVGNYKVLIIKYIQIMICTILSLVAILAIVRIFPNQILWVLGKEYAGLKMELMYVVTGSCLSLLSTISFSLYSSRGWVFHGAIALPLNLATIIVGILLFNLSTFQGVLYFNIFNSFCLFISSSVFCIIKILQLKKR